MTITSPPTPRVFQQAAPVTGWREVFSVRVVGIPKAQPRARAFAKPIGGGKFSARMYDSGTAEAWKADVARAIEKVWDKRRLEGPVRIDIDFLFPRSKKLMRQKDPDGRMLHASRPDRDNLEKAVLDCFTRLGLWQDDGQVCAGEVAKYYAAKNEQSGAELRVSTAEWGLA